MFLTKSDFKVCFDCRTRLFYRKNGYPSNSEENEYLQFLAEGGFMIELIAKARFPEGIDLASIRDAAQATARTGELLTAEDCTIFEAGFIHGKFHVRTDILRKRGREIELIEVKSSSIEDEDDDATSPFLTKRAPQRVTSRWRKYFLDLAFQTHVVRLACPGITVKPILCVVNKATIAAEHETLGNFHLTKDPANPKARPHIVYAPGEARIRDSRLLVYREVSAEIGTLMGEVITRADTLAALLTDAVPTRVAEPLSLLYGKCRKCDYKTDGALSGFRECWGELARVDPHILDLHRVTQIGDPDPVAALIAANRAGLLDLTNEQLGTNSWSVRRRMQWNSLRNGGIEYLPQALREELAAHQALPGWPLHFIDFEACDIALPHHAGMRPFERVAFQWSCHTLGRDGVLHHTEWLNDKREFPNFGFAVSLRERLGEEGTVYVWSWYEKTTLEKILGQIQAWLAADSARAVQLSGLPNEASVRALADWIERILGPLDNKGKRHNSPRIRDLHAVAEAHYFHPFMGGRTSIKVVLPSVWTTDAQIRAHPCFAAYAAAGASDPYATLPLLPLGENEEEEEAIREGTGAIRVYQDLIFDANATDVERATRRQLLLQYCRLDTAAMVMIWAHWIGTYNFRSA